ncbi:hypothetical protein P692DRAFT_20876552 [Suillus brevipes Sb2]|nr:hypothetical protein P692DRAFT_20876552 [Suillus brevipes Sb2]
MSSKSPRKTTADHRKRYNPYTRPTSNYETSNHGSVSLHTVPLARGFALYFDDYHILNTQPLWMGSAMIVDEPNRSSGIEQDVPTPSIDLAGDEMDIFHIVPALNAMANVGIAGHLCPQKRKLVRSLQKAVNKCIDSSCERGHPTTNLLRTSIHTALEVALLDIVVSEIMPSEIMPSHPPKNNRQKGKNKKSINGSPPRGIQSPIESSKSESSDYTPGAFTQKITNLISHESD